MGKISAFGVDNIGDAINMHGPVQRSLATGNPVAVFRFSGPKRRELVMHAHYCEWRPKRFAWPTTPANCHVFRAYKVLERGTTQTISYIKFLA